MQRRNALRYLFFVGGSALLLPACTGKNGQPVIKLKHLKIPGDDLQSFALFADTIIPKTETPGAVDLGVQLFALKMMDDCFNREDQQAFEKGLNMLNRHTKNTLGKTFSGSSANERVRILAGIMKNEQENNDLKTFVSLGKQLVQRGYTQSEYFMTKVQPYIMVPGHFSGCVDVAGKKSA